MYNKYTNGFYIKVGCLIFFRDVSASIKPKTSKTVSVLNQIETNKVIKECYLIRQDNIIYKFSIKI